jgi:hypothetical protein
MVTDHTMFMYLSQKPSKWCRVVLTTGLLPALRICRLLASVVAAKFKQQPLSLLQLHDTTQKEATGVCVCVFSHYSPHEKVVFPFHQRLLTSPPVVTIAILTVMADSHMHRPAAIDSLHMSQRLMVLL